jgi:lipopolysaccharide transport system ATP-binding protein
MNDQVVIKLSNVGLGYKTRSVMSGSHVYWAVKDVSFSVYSGECLGIIGRNGAGKSTLLKILAGILQPDKGTVEVLDDHVASLLTLQLGFSSNLSGRDNAIMSGMLLGKSKQEVMKRMTEVIRFSELGKFIDEPLSSYSSGMKARLGFSVAMLAEPDILLIDEVIGVGDASFKARSTKAIEDMVNSDRTAIVVSHSVETIEKLCNRVVWIENGVVVMEDEAQKVVKVFNKYNYLVSQVATKTDRTEQEVREEISESPLDTLKIFDQPMAEIVEK